MGPGTRFWFLPRAFCWLPLCFPTFPACCIRLPGAFARWERWRLSIGVSALGGFAHNAAQLAVAAFAVRTAHFAAYFPILAFLGLASGILNGWVANLSLKRLHFP